MRNGNFVFIFLFFFTGLTGCTTLNSSNDQIVADINGKMVVEKDLINLMTPDEQATYIAFKKEKINRIVAQTLLEQEAERRKISLRDFLEQEVFSKSQVSPDEVESYYRKNKKQYQKKAKKEWEKEIMRLLQTQKQQSLTKNILSVIAKGSKVQYYLPSISTEVGPGK